MVANYRRPIRAAVETIGTSVRGAVFRGAREDPTRWLNRQWDRHFAPALMKARHAREAADRMLTRATEALESASSAYPGGTPGIAAVVVTVLTCSCLAVVICANTALDWSLNQAFSRSTVLATLLTMMTVTVPVGLSLAGQAVYRRRPTAGRDAETGAATWSSETVGLAMIGLAVAYALLFVFVGVLGDTRAARVNAVAVENAESSYETAKAAAAEDFDPQIRLAERAAAEGTEDGVSAQQMEALEDAAQDLRDAKSGQISAAARTKSTELANLERDKTADRQKWIAYSVGGSVAESFFSYFAKDGIMLVRLGTARRRERQAREHHVRTQNAAERATARVANRFAWVAELASVPAEVVERWAAGHPDLLSTPETATRAGAPTRGDAPAGGGPGVGEAPEDGPGGTGGDSGEAGGSSSDGPGEGAEPGADPAADEPADGDTEEVPTRGFDEA
jgi:hypothetical protein